MNKTKLLELLRIIKNFSKKYPKLPSLDLQQVSGISDERIEEILKSSVVITKDADNGIDERIVYIKVILETEEVLNKRTKKYLEKLLKRRSVKQNSELLNNLCKMVSSKALRERKDSYKLLKLVAMDTKSKSSYLQTIGDNIAELFTISGIENNKDFEKMLRDTIIGKTDESGIDLIRDLNEYYNNYYNVVLRIQKSTEFQKKQATDLIKMLEFIPREKLSSLIEIVTDPKNVIDYSKLLNQEYLNNPEIISIMEYIRNYSPKDEKSSLTKEDYEKIVSFAIKMMKEGKTEIPEMISIADKIDAGILPFEYLLAEKETKNLTSETIIEILLSSLGMPAKSVEKLYATLLNNNVYSNPKFSNFLEAYKNSDNKESDEEPNHLSTKELLIELLEDDILNNNRCSEILSCIVTGKNSLANNYISKLVIEDSMQNSNTRINRCLIEILNKIKNTANVQQYHNLSKENLDYAYYLIQSKAGDESITDEKYLSSIDFAFRIENHQAKALHLLDTDSEFASLTDSQKDICYEAILASKRVENTTFILYRSKRPEIKDLADADFVTLMKNSISATDDEIEEALLSDSEKDNDAVRFSRAVCGLNTEQAIEIVEKLDTDDITPKTLVPNKVLEKVLSTTSRR